MLDYAYSARRFPPVILLNFFGGQINEPLKQTLSRSLTQITEWRQWGINLVLSTNRNVKMHKRRRQ